MSRCGMPATACATWRAPSTASDPGTTPWLHAELAVSLAQDADRVQDLGLVHSVAAVVPALRGDWEVGQRARPDGHRGRARLPATAETITAAAIAQAFLAAAWGDLQGVTDAAAAVRATARRKS